MSKHKSPLFFLLLILAYSFNAITPASGLGIGPPSFDLNVPVDGLNSTTFYVTSDGLDGELIVGTENLPFKVEPSRINISADDVNKPVLLTFYGNETLEPGLYEGKVTFLAMTGDFIAVGIKIKANITLVESPKSLFNFDKFTLPVTGIIVAAAVIVIAAYKISRRKRSNTHDKETE